MVRGGWQRPCLIPDRIRFETKPRQMSWRWAAGVRGASPVPVLWEKTLLKTYSTSYCSKIAFSSRLSHQRDVQSLVNVRRLQEDRDWTENEELVCVGPVEERPVISWAFGEQHQIKVDPVRVVFLNECPWSYTVAHDASTFFLFFFSCLCIQGPVGRE